jgi:poly(A) polymerase Pap1
MGAILRLIVAGVLSWATVIGTLWAAETIHTWIDSEGVRHFSTTAPPENVRYHEILVQEDDGSGSTSQDNMRRQSYDSMVEKAKTEAGRLEQERLQVEAEKRKREKEEAQKRRDAVIEAKRRELQKKIDALNQRALSPTFSKGMRDSQIKAIQEEIEQMGKEAGQPN